MTRIDRRDFLAAAALAPTGLAAQQESRPTNLLFILADQWRGSALGCDTDSVVRTPNLDRFAQQGATWRRAYATDPVCTPNRACILTGRYPHQTGMIKNDLQIPPDEVCWPEVFREAGYATHYIGKWHLDGTPKPGFVPPGWRRRGFSTFEGFNRGHVYHKAYGFLDDGTPVKETPLGLRDPYYEPSLQTDLAIDFLRRNQEGPFACYLSWGPPHTPFQPPESFDRYQPGEIRLRENVPEDHHDRARKDLAGYYGLCESLDHEMGRLMAFLDESGLAENTLVIFTADHGELAGSHGKYRKGEPEEESLRVPLLMRQPGRIPAQTELSALTGSVDLMPTLLSLCELEVPATCVGRDLSATALGGEDAAAVESLYCEGKVSSRMDTGPGRNSPVTGPWRTIVTQRYKLTVRDGYDSSRSLYDLQEDPLELRNLAGTPELRATEAEMAQELRDWGSRTGDTFPKVPPSALSEYSGTDG